MNGHDRGTRKLSAALAVAAGLALAVGCGGGDGEAGPDAGSAGFTVGGTASGLPAGEAVSLRLEATGVNALLSVSENGAFSFGERLADGSSYLVTVAGSPEGRDCQVDNGVGAITGADVTAVEVVCAHPELSSLSLSAPTPLSPAFSPDETSYAADVSVLVHSVTVSAEASPAEAVITLDGIELTSGVPSPPVPLALGATTLEVVVALDGVERSYAVTVDRGAAVLAQVAYAKASNTDAVDSFGTSIALDGDTLVVGANAEDSSATGVDGDQADDSASTSGAVYVFRRSGSSWAQEAYLKASNTGANDHFGSSVALSGDTLAVGAAREDSSAIGVDGNQADDGAADSGAVYVFRRSGSSWAQEAYLKASNTDANDHFGSSVALSGDTLAVGADFEASSATGVDGDQGDDSAFASGAVYVFRRSGSAWAQEAYLKASNTDSSDLFGSSVALFGDSLAVGASLEDSSAIGVDGNQADNSASNSGAVYVFRRSGSAWAQEAYLKASNTGANDAFGGAIALSGDTLAVGADGEDSSATGVAGNQADDSATNSGAVYVFRRSGSAWAQEAYLKASNTGADDWFGRRVALSGDMLAVGAPREDSGATGVGGNQADDSASSSGAAYVFRRAGSAWAQEAYLKASNTGAGDSFGASVALSGDTLAVGAVGEESSATGIDGNQADDSATASGATYVFH